MRSEFGCLEEKGDPRTKDEDIQLPKQSQNGPRARSQAPLQLSATSSTSLAACSPPAYTADDRGFLFAPNESPASYSPPAPSPPSPAQSPTHEEPQSPSTRDSRSTSFTFLDPMTPIFPLRRQSYITLNGRRSSRSQAARRVVSHAAKKPDGHIPRPPNCFLLYRSWVRQQQKLAGANGSDTAGKKNEQSTSSYFLLGVIAADRVRSAEVSVIVGTLWEDLPEEKKEIFRAEARRLKEEHMVSTSSFFCFFRVQHV